MSRTRFFWIPLIISLCFSTFAANQAQSLNVSIYYESLCPGCIRFMTTQLAPAYLLTRDYLILDFVPYGKVNVTKVSDGTLNYTCQHGPNECYSNKIQGCAVRLSAQNAAELFITCAMDSEDPSNDEYLERCARASGVSWDDVQECMNNGQGEEIIAANGRRTEAMNVTYVPTIVFNGVYNETLQELGENSFWYTVCLLLQPKPITCIGGYFD